jgi:hypothetical protein
MIARDIRAWWTRTGRERHPGHRSGPCCMTWDSTGAWVFVQTQCATPSLPSGCLKTLHTGKVIWSDNEAEDLLSTWLGLYAIRALCMFSGTMFGLNALVAMQ